MTNMDTALSARTVVSCLRVLAAATYRQRVVWQTRILQDAEVLANLQAFKLPAEIAALFQEQAGHVIHLVHVRLDNGFPRQVAVESIVAHLQMQCVEWIGLLTTSCHPYLPIQNPPPFMDLPPEDQAPYYVEGINIFRVIASVGGLVLPDPLPSAQLDTPAFPWWRRWLHRCGFHDGCLMSEELWHQTCQVCHKTRNYHY